MDTHPGDVPSYPLPSWLEGLRFPATPDEALAFAEAHGAPKAALAFLDALPAAVFTSDAGLHHALSELDAEHLARTHPHAGTMAHDGGAS